MSNSVNVPNYKKILQSSIHSSQTIWKYDLRGLPIINDQVPTESDHHVILKLISFGENGITLSFDRRTLNRILALDRPSKFCAVSFGEFKFEDNTTHKIADYIKKFLLNGLSLNNTLYKCIGWSNSQLKSRSCLLYAFAPGEDPMQRLNTLGEFGKIMRVGKKAKRIGLLFSEIKFRVPLSKNQWRDIPDIVVGGQVFSDGCGLMSTAFAKRLARSNKITFHGIPYIPSVVQIRYRGYKGILMVNPRRNMDGQVHFRKSMHKFTSCSDLDNTLSVLDYSTPYKFGKLNLEFVTVLSSLGISDDVFHNKQQEYFDLITKASEDPIAAFKFLSYMGDQESANSIALNGLGSVKTALKKAQEKARANMFDKKKSERVHIMISKSRFLFGVCDPTGKLQEDECYLRVTIEGDGIRSLVGAWVIVTRNPCLHPGDIRKLRVTQVKELEPLVDCIVFPTTGRVPQPSMMGGGDLDGDMFFVCWDSDLIPTILHEPHFYPSAKEGQRCCCSYEDYVHYFAHWNTSVGIIAKLYSKWVRGRKSGANSKECKGLNHLYSLALDGEKVVIPEKLKSPPERRKEWGPFIVDQLIQHVSDRLKTIRFGLGDGIINLNADVIELLASADDICMSEFELFQLVNLWASKHKVDMSQFIDHFDFGAMTTDQKAWIRTSSTFWMDPSVNLEALVNNGLLQSEVLGPHDVELYGLDSPRLHWRRLYQSDIDGHQQFVTKLTSALEDFTRKFLVIDVNSETRFKVGILISKRIKPIEERDDTVVDDSIIAFPFRPGNYINNERIRTTKGHQIGWDGSSFQLFNVKRSNTFIWFGKTQANVQNSLGLISIALNRFGENVVANIGRLQKKPIRTIEIYVISNRDRVGHDILDISFANVPTEDTIPRIVNIPQEYSLESIEGIDWSLYSPKVREIVEGDQWDLLRDANAEELDQIGKVCHRVQDSRHLLQLVRWHLENPPPYDTEQRLTNLLNHSPRLCVLMADLALDESLSVAWDRMLQSPSFTKTYFTALIQSANYAPGLVTPLFTASLDKAAPLSFDCSLNLMSIIPTTVRSSLLAVELITLLYDNLRHPDRYSSLQSQLEMDHLFTLARNVCIDRCAEAEKLCECDEWGIPLAEKSECMIDPIEVEDTLVTVSHRVDIKLSFRVGDHVRLRSASLPKDEPFRRPRVMDGLIKYVNGEQLKIELMEAPPPERCSWYILPAGNNTTASKMMEAIHMLAEQKHACCRLYTKLIPGIMSNISRSDFNVVHPATTKSNLNESQREALVESSRNDLTLVWGPPGTGKTTTVIHIIDLWRKSAKEDDQILVTASTNNAVDNILEKYISMEGASIEDIVRVHPDGSPHQNAVLPFWVGAFIDGDINKPSRAMQEARKKISRARIVFTTCTGAALGSLRERRFTYVIVDEASQITEPNCLISLVKGCQKAVLVGDHVQLRPTVTPLGAAYGYDVSLFERLYTQPEMNGIAKVMLNTQYRMHPQIARFPSTRFYKGKLLSGVTENDRRITETKFDWKGKVIRFVDTPGLETSCRESKSKSNEIQAKICKIIVSSLQQLACARSNAKGSSIIDSTREHPSKMSIAVITPYSKQADLLKELESLVDSKTISSITVATVDSFQGREADIVIFCTVRCNESRNIGFLADERRMNVALTRARRGLIVIGHKDTLVQSSEGGKFWNSWFKRLL